MAGLKQIEMERAMLWKTVFLITALLAVKSDAFGVAKSQDCHTTLRDVSAQLDDMMSKPDLPSQHRETIQAIIVSQHMASTNLLIPFRRTNWS